MNVSQKCQYALRAVFELASRNTQGPIRIGEIAAAQAIPQRFLEVILGELKHGGFVESRRGMQGGYMLTVSPKSLCVGQIIEFLDGPLGPVKCVAEPKADKCPLDGNCAFMDLWEQARNAIAEVYHSVTFQDLVDKHNARQKYIPCYTI